MKSSNHPQSSSSIRYKLASLKRFLNFMVWGPPLVLAAVLYTVWQYQQHPEWLSGTSGNTLPQTNQFEEPGIYDDSDLSGQNLDNGNNLDSFTQVPPLQRTPLPNFNQETNNAPSLNPTTADNTQPNNRSGISLPNLFLPLVPSNNKGQGNNPPSANPVNPSSLPEFEVNPNGESELQKAVRRNLNTSSSSPITPPAEAFNPRQPIQSRGITSPLNPQVPRNNVNNPYFQENLSPNPTSPYATQPIPPQTSYQPPANNPSTPSNLYEGASGQNYIVPPINKPYNNPYRTGNVETAPNSPQTINGRPAPYFQPSIDGYRSDY